MNLKKVYQKIVELRQKIYENNNELDLCDMHNYLKKFRRKFCYTIKYALENEYIGLKEDILYKDYYEVNMNFEFLREYKWRDEYRRVSSWIKIYFENSSKLHIYNEVYKEMRLKTRWLANDEEDSWKDSDYYSDTSIDYDTEEDYICTNHTFDGLQEDGTYLVDGVKYDHNHEPHDCLICKNKVKLEDCKICNVDIDWHIHLCNHRNCYFRKLKNKLNFNKENIYKLR